jgi:hypothetical protein
MATSRQWIVFKDDYGDMRAVEDEHDGTYGILKSRGYKIIGTPYEPTAKRAIEYVEAYTNY